MNENKDLKTIKECIHQIRWSDADGEYDMIIDAAERMAAEIERLETQGKVACELFDELKISQKENFDLKAELEKKEKVLNELRPYLEPAGVEYNDLEEMFDEKHIDRDGPDMVLVPTSHWNKIQTAFYVGRTQTLGFKAELEKRPEVVYCKDCTRAFCTNITLALKCRIWRVQVSPNAFCSRGQRRKSEEGK